MRYYKVNEEIELRFYQMPKALFQNPMYKGLSLGAKAMYSILRDRQDLSIKNEWYDSNGYIYSIYTIEDLAEIIEMDRKSVMRYKQELVKYKLLIDKRVGQGKPNKLYVLKPEVNEVIQKSQNGTSTNPHKGLQEVPNIHPNDTDLNKTDLNDDDDDDKHHNEILFLHLLQKHKIPKDMANSLYNAISNELCNYEPGAISIAFEKLMLRVRNQSIKNVPKWFASTLESQNFTTQQAINQQQEIETMLKKYL